MALFVRIGFLIYNNYQIEKEEVIETNEERVKQLLREFDLNEINRLLEVVKKEMRELPDKSSLTDNQKTTIIRYCDILLFNYGKKDFTPERRAKCIEIKNYCSFHNLYLIAK